MTATTLTASCAIWTAVAGLRALLGRGAVRRQRRRPGGAAARLDQLSPKTLIADGESNPDVDQLLEIAADRAIDVLLMDTVSYGLTAWRAADADRREDRRAGVAARLGLPLKTLYAAQLAAGLGNMPIIEAVPGSTVDRRHQPVRHRRTAGSPSPTCRLRHPRAGMNQS